MGHSGRRHRARRGPGHRRADQPAILDPGRASGLPGRAGFAPGRHPGGAGGAGMTTPRDAVTATTKDTDTAAPAAPDMTGTARQSPLARYRVQRWTPLSRAATAAALALVVALIFVPPLLGTNVTQQLTSLLILVILAVMWNALAGYGGLVSVGQQAYIGLGAYGAIYLTQLGVQPYAAMLLAALGAGVVALPVSLLVLRLRGGQFAIGTWVVAEVFALVVVLDPGLGGCTGTSLT